MVDGIDLDVMGGGVNGWMGDESEGLVGELKEERDTIG